MKWDFSREKIIAAVLAVAAFGVLRLIDAPYWVALLALIVIAGWGPDIWQRLRR